MKTALLTTAIAAALVVTQVAAQGMDDRSGPRGFMASFAELDANGDGNLTLEEMSAAGAARFALADTDGDGGLSVAELQARAEEGRLQRMADRVASMLGRRDSNGDGLLQRDEMIGRGAGPERMFDRLDANDDGVVTQAEFDTMQAKMQDRMHERRADRGEGGPRGDRGDHGGRGDHGRHGEHGEHEGPRDRG